MAQRGADEEERTEPDAPPAGPLAPDRLEPAPALPVRTVPA
jgi:hypothetical protein